MAPRALFAAVALLAQATAAAAGQEKMDCGDVWAEVPAGERCAAFAACTGDANAYMNWYSCARTTGARGPLLAAYVVLLCLLFVLLGSTAEEFFAPALEQMSRDMGLPPRFAGVTLLALGNGAPDVSATIAAVTNGGDGYLLSLGALTGAGMFVGTVVAGIVMTIAGGVTARGALVRDVCMYTVTLVVVMTMFISGYIDGTRVATLLAMYFGFIAIVLAADIYHRKVVLPRMERADEAGDDVRPSFFQKIVESFTNYDDGSDNPRLSEDVRTASRGGWVEDYEVVLHGDHGQLHLADHPHLSRHHHGHHSTSSPSLASYDTLGESPAIDARSVSLEHGDRGGSNLAAALTAAGGRRPSGGSGTRTSDAGSDESLPLSFNARLAEEVREIVEDFNDMKLVWKVCFLLELPFTIARKLTIPLTSEDEYCRPLLAISVACMPLWLAFYFDVYGSVVLGAVPVVAVMLAVSIPAAVLCAKYTSDQAPPAPVPAAVIALVGFAVAATWIDQLANNLVDLLAFAGALLAIPDAIMGLTVLAWGNSVGDLSTNMAMARKGLANMAITACFAGPVFNMLIGLGLGFSLLLQEERAELIKVSFDPALLPGFVFLMANCLLVALFGVANKNFVPKGFGVFAILLYVAYLVVSFMCAFKE